MMQRSGVANTEMGKIGRGVGLGRKILSCFRHTEFWMHFTYIHPETMRSFPHQSSEFKSGEVWATGGKTTPITTKKLRLPRGWMAT